MRNVPTVPVRLRLPRANSAMISGIDQRKRKINQGTRKEPPPLAPTILGKRQMLPVPIAAPIVAKIRPMRPLNSSEPPESIQTPSLSFISGGRARTSRSSSNIAFRVNPSPPQTIVAMKTNIRTARIAEPKPAR